MAAERGALPRPGLAAFAGLSWSAWLERDGPTRDGGSGSEPEEGGKSSPRRADTVTLIKEDMDIFGHCPAHDDFYLVVCNQCSRVVKPQAFQKHCERRHSPLTPPCAWPPPRPLPVPGAPPGAARAPPGARGRSQTLPEHLDNNNNHLCLFVPVVNLEKIPGIPKPDGHGFKEPPKGDSRESPGPREPPVPGGVGGDSALPGDKDLGVPKAPPRSHRKPPRKECDLSRQCGVRNPHSDTPCTRLLTCKIHSVQQRRAVPGRAKDFDVLLAELRGARRGDPPPARDGGPPRKDPQPHLPPHATQGLPTALPQPPSAPPGTPLCPQHPTARAWLCSDSDPEDAPAAPGEGGTGGAPPGKGGGRGGSEDSDEEEGAQEPPRTPRPPRPQGFCAFGSRLLSPGCYVFHRRLDRVCSALREMLRRHRRPRAWRKIPPATDPPLHPPETPTSPAAPAPTPIYVPAAPSPPPSRPLPAPGVGRGVPPNLTYAVGSPPAAAACSPPEGGGGGSQSVTSPLPAHTPSPSSSKLPPPKAPRPPREPPRPWRTPPRAGRPPYKRACVGEGLGGGDRGGGPPIAHLNGAPRVRRLPPPAPTPSGGRDPLAGPGGSPRGLSEDQAKKRRNSATYCRPPKAKAAPTPPVGPPAPAPPGHETPGPGGGSESRRRVGTPPRFQEEGRDLKSKAH